MATVASPVDNCAYDIGVLGHRIQISGPAEFVRRFARLRPPPSEWAALAGDAPPVRLLVQPDTEQRQRYAIVGEGQSRSGIRRSSVLPWLDLAVNTAVLELLAGRHLLFHAGAVAWEGQGIVFPAASGSGKTTLVAGLLAAGFQYLSDEVAVIDPASGHLLPFPKNLLVKSGARHVLIRRYPALREEIPSVRFGRKKVWYLPPPPLAWPAGPIPLRHVILPRYVARSRTELIPITRSECLARFLEQSFNLRAHGREGVAQLLAVLRGATCHALTVGDLDAATNLIQNLVETTPPSA